MHPAQRLKSPLPDREVHLRGLQPTKVGFAVFVGAVSTAENEQAEQLLHPVIKRGSGQKGTSKSTPCFSEKDRREFTTKAQSHQIFYEYPWNFVASRFRS